MKQKQKETIKSIENKSTNLKAEKNKKFLLCKSKNKERKKIENLNSLPSSQNFLRDQT